MDTPKGWQPIAAAAKQLKVSRQRLHILARDGKIPSEDFFGRLFVPKPLKYKVNRKQQKITKESRIKVLTGVNKSV